MRIRPIISAVLSAALIVTAMPVQAEMVGTNGLLAQEARTTRMADVQAFIAREDVRGQMEMMGVDPARAAERVAAMTDSELQQVAQNLQDMPAGGSAAGVILTVILILILLELIGAINIFSRI